uniref:lytic cellulose monooxygenase (C4-dehydrogenating) n=1 Tax=Rhizophlyctis rosea TaxID=64517 RepID=A0A2U8U9Q8_9FUNG|nr:lytic polysaccharide monooxygenase 9 [Rhizophlyctis rosea]
MFSKVLLATALMASTVAAHTNFRGFLVGNQAVPTSDWGYCVRPVGSNSPIQDYTSSQMICNTVTGTAPGTCSAMPGDSVTMIWHEHSMTETIAVSGKHYGPIQAYMARIPDATQSSVTGLKWFKVYSRGLIRGGMDPGGQTTADADSTSGSGYAYWATQEANTNKGLIKFNLPCDLAPGDYLLRSELIALHAAGPGTNGAQVYTGCAQLRVGGSGTGNPSTVTDIKYSTSDPGIGINIHTTLNSYTPPGPAVYVPQTCSGGGGNTGGNPTTTTQRPVTTTTTTRQQQTTTTTTRAQTTTTQSSGQCAAKYAQCGGQG